MKSLVVLPLILCLVQADSSDKQEVKLKPTSPTSNTIIPTQKYEMFYSPPIKYQQPIHQPIATHKPQYVPVQLIPKQYYMPQPQAMIIIAQPALVPQSLLYNSATQQLLNYFHSNPQAKYQLLHGNYQAQQPQHQVVAAPSYGNYIVAAAPTQYPQYQQYQQVVPQVQVAPIQSNAITAHYAQQPSTHLTQAQLQYSEQQQQQQQPTQLSNIAHLAQLAAQQYVSSPLKSTPAIVTGFENFTPEQQAQIKAQLSQHLGSNFHAVSNGPSATSSNSAPSTNQYSAKYVAEQDTNDFVPSPQIQNEMSSTKSDILKTTMRIKDRTQ